MDIAYKSETKFLGIYIRENLTINMYVKSLSSKLSKICYMIGLLKDIMSPHVIRRIYFVYFQAYLRYGLIFGVVILEVKSYLNCKSRSYK
jgi:hypothetical protein